MTTNILVPKPNIVVGVIFLDSEAKNIPSANKVYHYFVPQCISNAQPDFFKVGQHVVVNGGDGRIALTRIEEVISLPTTVRIRATKSILGTVDMSHYEREVTRVKRREEVLLALTVLDQQRLERARFAELAKGDEQAAKLFAELQQLDGI